MNRSLKFCVFTDLHYDVIPDGDRRIYELLQDCKQKDVDFLIELGDLCYPCIQNRNILNLFKNSGVPCYFSIGNHNIDGYSLETVLDFFQIENGYYSIIKGNIKFIFLNANYSEANQDYLSCTNAIQTYCSFNYPYIPEKQLKWLEREMADDNLYYIICSHHSLSNDFIAGNHSRGIVNREQVRHILERRNSHRRAVLFCMNGHDHGDDIKIINNIYYYTVNSASYIWQGVKETFSYSKEIHLNYPYLKNLILYQEPLHIIVTIDEHRNVKIDGINGHYQTITPEEIGMGNIWNGISIESKTSSIYIENNE